MIAVEACLVSEDVVEQKFRCNIQACKGACCIEGDAGAPLEKHEAALIKDNIDLIKTQMDEQGIASLNELGISETDSFSEEVTTCKPNKECVFAIRTNGILGCSIEVANAKHNFGFQKPISCHLYPIRVAKYGEYHAVNYHKWSICSDACVKGEHDNVYVYQFNKDALIRKFGEQWYNKLALAAEEHLAKL